MGTLVSPNEMFEAAKDAMIGGREPQTDDDWAKIVNFFAFNIQKDVVHSAMKLMKMIYSIPLSDELITQICDFQVSQR